MHCCFVLLQHDTRAIAWLTVRKSSALQNHYSTIPQCDTVRLNCSKTHCVLHMTVLHFCIFTAGGSFGLLPIVPISILFWRILEDGDDNAAHVIMMWMTMAMPMTMILEAVSTTVRKFHCYRANVIFGAVLFSAQKGRFKIYKAHKTEIINGNTST